VSLDEDLRREQREAAAGNPSRRRLVELTRLASALAAVDREAKRALDAPIDASLVPIVPEHVRHAFSIEAALVLRDPARAGVLADLLRYWCVTLRWPPDRFWQSLLLDWLAARARSRSF
jgi:hypothetical protein